MSYISGHKDKLLFVPLGGCGEIGMNLNLYGAEGKWIMVDLGMTFGEPGVPGVDLMFPDTSFAEREKKNILALVVTHGHEDHIGAIPYLWSRLRCPIYATPFTKELVRLKLEEAGLAGQVPLYDAKPGDDIALGPFSVRYVPLAHSIAEGNGLKITTKFGTLFHTGDWKMDDGPVIGPESPDTALKAIGDEGVLALIGDSTNVFNANASGSEQDVQNALIKLVTSITKGRIVVTTFASNVARLQSLGEVVKASGRTMVLMGRSMHRIVGAAQETGYLADFPAFEDEDALEHLPKDKVLIVCTGCQGEYRAAMSRIARQEHKAVSLSAGDTVIFSSKIIPGNEIELGRLFNQLAEQDINVITEKDDFVHVSGHPGRAELAEMFALTRPHIVVPVHGEVRHIKRHAEFAHECGIEHTYRPKNGDVISLTKDGAKKIDEVAVGRLILDGNAIVPLAHDCMAERRRLMQNGYVGVHVALDEDGQLFDDPIVNIVGLPYDDLEEFTDDLLDTVEVGLDRMKKRDVQNDRQVEEACRVAVRRFCRKEIGKNPVVEVMITRTEDLPVMMEAI